MLLRRTVDLQSALKMGIRIELDEVPADVFAAMLLLDEERDRLNREQSNNASC